MAVLATTSAIVRLCHPEIPEKLINEHTVWSNFEIADMDFWRGEAYTAFFNYLDRSGGFYYEVQISTVTFAPHDELFKTSVSVIHIALG
jgi:hypothetical protein